MVAGIFSFSVMTGVYVSKTKNFRWFPITGNILLMIGTALLYLMRANTNYGLVRFAVIAFELFLIVDCGLCC